MAKRFQKQFHDNVPPRTTGALERVVALEQNQTRLFQAVGQSFGVVEAKVSESREIIEALVSLMGRKTVEDEMRRLKIESLEADAEAKRIALASAIENNQVTAAEVVGNLSVVIGTEVDSRGEKLYPARVQMLFQALRPEFQEQIVGKKVGDMIPTPTGGQLTILEVYDINPEAELPVEERLPTEVPAQLGPTTDASEQISEEEAQKIADELDTDQFEEKPDAALEEQLLNDLDPNKIA